MLERTDAGSEPLDRGLLGAALLPTRVWRRRRRRLLLPLLLLPVLSLAFREGMTGAKRAQRLGDPDEENRSWLWSDADKKLHGVLMVYSVPGYTGVKDVTDAGYKADALAHLGVQYPLIVSALRGAHVLMRLPDALVHPEAKGHFGFRDGISQPYIAGSNTSQRPRGDMAAANIVQPGEFVLGHVNESGVVVPPLWLSRKKTQRRFQYLRDDGLAAGRADFGRNGSYLVFRQLSMDKEGFNEFIAANAPDGNGDLLRAKIVGRWPSGAPLVKTPDKDAPEMGTDNDFLFMQEDRYGYRCPVGSHIRRSNPRDALANERAGISPQASLNRSRRARIIRRSRPYGSFASSEDADERGLHFICLNASLRDQFEFIQSAWVNNKEFAGLRGEVDPLIGTAGPHPSAYTMQKAPISDQVGMKNFVSVAGGGYFFMPGMNALRFIAG